MLDPSSRRSAQRAFCMQLGWTEAPVNFLGQRDAFTFDLLGYEIAFPMALTISDHGLRGLALLPARRSSSSSPACNRLARDMYEAAEIDGVTPLQQFWALSLPHTRSSSSSILFLLRFIWNVQQVRRHLSPDRRRRRHPYPDGQRLRAGDRGMGEYRRRRGRRRRRCSPCLLCFALVFFRMLAPKEECLMPAIVQRGWSSAAIALRRDRGGR